MPHEHQYRVTHYTLLTLPDVEAFADRYTSWVCVTCGHHDALSGCIKLGVPLRTPAFWIAQMGLRVVSRPGSDPRTARSRL